MQDAKGPSACNLTSRLCQGVFPTSKKCLGICNLGNTGKWPCVLNSLRLQSILIHLAHATRSTYYTVYSMYCIVYCLV